MIHKVLNALLGENKAEVWRYIGSGLASGASMLLMSFSCRALGVGEGLSTTIGVLFSFAVSFLLQKYWVFRSQRSVGVASLRFGLVTTITWLISLGLYQIMVGVWHWPFWAVQLGVMFCVAFCNFTINRLWTFRAPREAGIK